MKAKDCKTGLTNCNRLIAYFVIVGIVLSVKINVYAAVIASVTTETVTETRTDDTGAIYFYIKGVDEIQSSTVQIGNALCEDISETKLIVSGIPIRTLLILDNSQSLSGRLGEKGPKDIMNGFIDNAVPGEEFKIVTVSDTYEELTDFTTDYDTLKTVISEIGYKNQTTYLTDCLYEYVSALAGSENFTRIIMITDGADNHEITYTQSELSDLLKSSNVVVHSIGASGGKADELERLFSYTRMSKGTGLSVSKSDDVSEIINLINSDYDIHCLRVVPPTELLDGSVKAVQLKLITEKGELTLVCNAQMSFGEVITVNEAESDSALESDPKPETAPKPATEFAPQEDISVIAPPLSNDSIPEEKKSDFPAIFVFICVLVLLAIAVVLTIMLKKKKNDDDPVVQKMDPVPQPQPEVTESKNEMMSGGSNQSDETVISCETNGLNLKTSRIVLSDTNESGRFFSANIIDIVTVGRKVSNTIVISDDAAVSSHHLEILKKGQLYYINDLNSSNGTMLNHVAVHVETPVMSGALVEIGHHTYKLIIED